MTSSTTQADSPATGWPLLQWTTDNCKHKQCIANTPFGRFSITWEPFERIFTATIEETPWGYSDDYFSDVEEAKKECQQELNRRLEAWLAASPYAPYAIPPRAGHILRLAAIIREVDGNNSLGAAALAEAILAHPLIGQVLPQGHEWLP
jgi:hypothetical protein